MRDLREESQIDIDENMVLTCTIIRKFIATYTQVRKNTMCKKGQIFVYTKVELWRFGDESTNIIKQKCSPSSHLQSSNEEFESFW